MIRMKDFGLNFRIGSVVEYYDSDSYSNDRDGIGLVLDINDPSLSCVALTASGVRRVYYDEIVGIIKV